MQSLNRVFLSGFLGSDPEKKTSKGGKEFYHLNLASHRSWQNKEKEWEERTDWHSLFCWSPRSKRLVEKLKKGQPLLVDGELITFERSTEDDKTIKSTAIEVKDMKTLEKQGKS